MKKMRFLITYNRCIFLHCFSFRACGLGFCAREVLHKKKHRRGVKEKWPKCQCAQKLPVHVLCQKNDTEVFDY